VCCVTDKYSSAPKWMDPLSLRAKSKRSLLPTLMRNRDFETNVSAFSPPSIPLILARTDANCATCLSKKTTSPYKHQLQIFITFNLYNHSNQIYRIFINWNMQKISDISMQMSKTIKHRNLYLNLSSHMLLVITHSKDPVSLRIPDPPDAKFTPCRMLFLELFLFFCEVKKGGGLCW